MKEEPKDRYLTPAQVAERYQLPIGWVYGCKELKEICRKFGKYNRYLESDLEVFEAGRGTRKGFNLMRRKEFAAGLKEERRKSRKFKLKFDIAE